MLSFKSLFLAVSLVVSTSAKTVPFYEIETGQIINVNVDASKINQYRTYELTLDDSDGNKLSAIHVREVVPHGSPLLKDSTGAQSQAYQTGSQHVVDHYSVPVQQDEQFQYQTPTQEHQSESTQDEMNRNVHPVFTSSSHAGTRSNLNMEEEESQPEMPGMFEINQIGVDPISLLALQAGIGGGFGGGFGGHGGHGGKFGGGGFGATPVLNVGIPYGVPTPYPVEEQKQIPIQTIQQVAMPVQTKAVQMPVVQQVMEQTQIQPVIQTTKQQMQPIWQPVQTQFAQTLPSQKANPTIVNPPIYAQPTIASTTWQTQTQMPVQTQIASTKKAH